MYVTCMCLFLSVSPIVCKLHKDRNIVLFTVPQDLEQCLASDLQ